MGSGLLVAHGSTELEQRMASSEGGTKMRTPERILVITFILTTINAAAMWFNRGISLRLW